MGTGMHATAQAGLDSCDTSFVLLLLQKHTAEALTELVRRVSNICCQVNKTLKASSTKANLWNVLLKKAAGGKMVTPWQLVAFVEEECSQALTQAQHEREAHGALSRATAARLLDAVPLDIFCNTLVGARPGAVRHMTLEPCHECHHPKCTDKQGCPSNTIILWQGTPHSINAAHHKTEDFCNLPVSTTLQPGCFLTRAIPLLLEGDTYARICKGAAAGPKYIVLNCYGQWVGGHKAFLKWWHRKVGQALGFPNMTLRNTRHAFATAMCPMLFIHHKAMGENPLERVMAHKMASSTKMLRDVYNCLFRDIDAMLMAGLIKQWQMDMKSWAAKELTWAEWYQLMLEELAGKGMLVDKVPLG